uniref:Ig-like domain-containing protein n=1 Tax=Monopterus albus TaxID=43700 RepID=A0A3Q3QG93_MONAL
MTVSWIILLLLCQGCTFYCMTTVQLGEPVTFTCFYPHWEYSNTRVKWYKQSIGDTLTLITTLMKAIANPTYEQGFPPSRFDVNDTTAFTTLTIKKTMQEDQAVYHCAVSTWSEDQWSGTYLFFKGDTYLCVKLQISHFYFPSDPVRPGDLVTLQCSVLFDNKTCLQEHSVYWFRTRSDDSHPSVIYAHLNSGDHCERSPEISSSQKCVYNLSRNVSSSDAGTYYCAVATCGEILFGSGTKLEIEGICILFNCFSKCVIVIAFLIYAVKKTKCDHCNGNKTTHVNLLILISLVVT